MDNHIIFAGFSLVFASLWVVVSVVLGFMSGWFELQQWFETPSGKPLLKLLGQSGAMGWVTFSGVLTLSAYRNGLGVRVWKIFGPFNRPFLVPWSEIEAEPFEAWFMHRMKLEFGHPVVGSLEISAQSWWELLRAARPETSVASMSGS